MSRDELIAQLQNDVKGRIEHYLRQQPTQDVVALDWMEALTRKLLVELTKAMFAAWNVVLQEMAQRIGVTCPDCGARRKCKLRLNKPMTERVLGLAVEVAKLYLECSHCDARGISITKLLTGLYSGSTSAELELRAAYLGAEHSYGKAGRALAVHYGQAVERTAVRRMGLRVEAHAQDFAERTRQEALAKVSGERRKEGPETLMFQGDGGSVRTGKLEPCEPGDPGYGQQTPQTKKPRRKRVTHGREVITFDVREPGEIEPTALDVVVPFDASEGERERRMLALAARKGLGDNTEMVGLGDMGSGLPKAFDEAFVGYTAKYYTDWHHICDYVQHAGAVLEKLDVGQWRKQMRDAIWERDVDRRDTMLQWARKHRIKKLPAHLPKCPVEALATYLTNNWDHMRSKELKSAGLDYVSARAEAQVRDRTRDRFAVAGAWSEDNIEPKATLRAIIAEGRWETFRKDYLQHCRTLFEKHLIERLEQAVNDGRLCCESVADLTGDDRPASGHQVLDWAA